MRRTTPQLRDLARKAVRRVGAPVAATAIVAGTIGTGVPAAHADPCFFTDGEWNQWYDGGRWGTSLSTIENNIANCQGTWYEGNPLGPWDGHTTYMKIWPQADGTQIKIVFAKYSSAPTYRAHDKAFNSGTVFYEWPRP